MKRLNIWIILVLVGVIAIGCSKEAPDEEVWDQIGVRGMITNITITDTGASMLVEGDFYDDTAYDKAQVSLDSKTKITSSMEDRTFSLDELGVGITVEVTFAGAVMESYPVQGYAHSVKIVSFDSIIVEEPTQNIPLTAKGKIIEIEPTETGGRILVEGEVSDESTYDKAWITVDSASIIQKDAMSRVFAFEDLEVGMTVMVYFGGPVAESYPVQGYGQVVQMITE